jgi:hypothetical protein
MGFFWEGLPPYLLPWSSQALTAPRVAVETGTFRGDTTILLANAFGSCTSIERSHELAAKAQGKFRNDPRIEILEGSSRDLLAQAIPSREKSAFFWLDAHGIYDFNGTEAEENPLLAEIDTVIAARDSSNTIIAIDDARGMGTQPDWPAMSEVAIPLGNAGYTTVYLDDIFLAIPQRLRTDLPKLYQESRMVEATAVFHIWPRVLRAFKSQARLDSLVEKLPNSLRR